MYETMYSMPTGIICTSPLCTHSCFLAIPRLKFLLLLTKIPIKSDFIKNYLALLVQTALETAEKERKMEKDGEITPISPYKPMDAHDMDDTA